MESKSDNAEDTEGDDIATMSPIQLSHGKTACEKARGGGLLSVKCHAIGESSPCQ